MLTLSTEHFAALQTRRRAFERSVRDTRVLEEVLPYSDDYVGILDRIAVCPCCGYPTLRARGHYEICNLCGWEDDGQDDPPFGHRPPYEVAGGPNADYSLTEARANFVAYGHQYRPADVDRFARMQRSADIRSALVELYESVLPTASPEDFVAIFPRRFALLRRYAEFLYESIGEPASYAQILEQARERNRRPRR